MFSFSSPVSSQFFFVAIKWPNLQKNIFTTNLQCTSNQESWYDDRHAKIDRQDNVYNIFAQSIENHHFYYQTWHREYHDYHNNRKNLRFKFFFSVFKFSFCKYFARFSCNIRSNKTVVTSFWIYHTNVRSSQKSNSWSNDNFFFSGSHYRFQRIKKFLFAIAK